MQVPEYEPTPSQSLGTVSSAGLNSTFPERTCRSIWARAIRSSACASALRCASPLFCITMITAEKARTTAIENTVIATSSSIIVRPLSRSDLRSLCIGGRLERHLTGQAAQVRRDPEPTDLGPVLEHAHAQAQHNGTTTVVLGHARLVLAVEVQVTGPGGRGTHLLGRRDDHRARVVQRELLARRAGVDDQRVDRPRTAHSEQVRAEVGVRVGAGPDPDLADPRVARDPRS